MASRTHLAPQGNPVHGFTTKNPAITGVAIRYKKCAVANDNKQLRCDRLTDLFNTQTARRQRSQEIDFIADVFEPSRPVRALQNDHLSVVNGRNIRPRCGREQRERFAALGHRPPQTGEAEPILARLRQLPLLLRRFGPGELEEMRGRDKTSTDWKSASFGTEIYDGRSFRSELRERRRRCSRLASRCAFLCADPYRLSDGPLRAGSPCPSCRCDLWRPMGPAVSR